MITRRRMLESTAFLAAAAALGLSLGDFVAPAHAQVPNDELMQAGPLGDLAMGAENAPVTIIEYASMTCSHCATFHTRTYPALKSKYIDTGKVRYILREFPLDPIAAGAFMLARCAPADKAFAVIEDLFKQQRNWAFVQNPIPPMFAVVKPHGFTEQSFEKCLSDQKLLDSIEAVRKRGEKFGVNSTPTFFINGKKVNGALSIEDIEREIQPYLKS